MNIYKDGDKSKAYCPYCEKGVSITYKYDKLKIKENIIPKVLQGFCDECKKSAITPHQSSLRIKEFIDASKQFNSRIPDHFRDILLEIGKSYRVSPNINTVFAKLLGFYISKNIHSKKSFANNLVNYLNDNLVIGPSKDRISCNISKKSYLFIKEVSEVGDFNMSILAKCLIVKAKYDLLDNTKTKTGKEFTEYYLKTY
jgi:hypothetical protein